MKIKTTDKKIEQNKFQFDLYTQIAKKSPLSSGNVGKYESFTGKDVLSEEDLSKKASTIKHLNICS